MIANIKIQYFFSFGKSQNIELNSGANILVGINGSGKSNFIKAIQFLYEGIAGNEGLENLVNKIWGGFGSVANCTADDIKAVSISYEFDWTIIRSLMNKKGFRFAINPIYEISINKQGAANYYFSEHIWSENNIKGGKPFTYLKTKNGRGFLSTREDEVAIKSAAFNSNELVLRQISEPDKFFPQFTLKKAIEEIIIYSYFDTTSNSLIRQLSPYYSDIHLLPNGENLANLLNYLNSNHTVAYDLIIEKIRDINPNFRELVFTQPTGGKTLLALKEKELSRAITVEHISDGTLRFLLLLSIFYNPNRGKVICLDEPEIGLHPDMIKSIAAGIIHASNAGTQFIIATHSPLLLNYFELEDLCIFEKSKNNQTIVSKKSEEDFPEWEGNFLIGQMWLRGVFGGVRW
jgi:predicted ATPase